MTKIKPKLYLNMSPQTQEEGSLAFARNMKVDDDGNLISDYGYSNIDVLNGHTILGHIVGLDNKIYFFTETSSGEPSTKTYHILEYDELTKSVTNTYNSIWTHGGGKITGCVNTNQSGEKILTVCEYDCPNDAKIPIKHINLSYPSTEESLYTQAPKVPITNITLHGTYVKTIPNGVYVFFIRYRIRKDVYTPWYLASSPMFAGTKERTTTLQGGLNYINIHRDSAKSFILSVDFVVPANGVYYDEYQVGFIITHDEATNARIWKSFKITTANNKITGPTTLYFDYEDVQEANIDDLLATSYNIFNVKNVTSFKNKLYISNYEETDFNKTTELGNLANKITVSYDTKNVFTGNTAYNTITTTYEYDGAAYSVPIEFDYSKGYYAIPSDAPKDPEETRSKFHNIVGYTLDESYNVSISKLVKVETREVKDILTFNIGWNMLSTPYLCDVYAINNNILYNEIFGASLDTKHGGIFTYITNNGGTNGSSKYSINDYTNDHPFYANNLSFVYSIRPSVSNIWSKDYGRHQVLFFKKGSNKYNSNYHYDNNGTYWVSHDTPLTTVERNIIEENIVNEIKGKNIAAICYIEFFYGTKVYKINIRIKGGQDDTAQQKLTRFLSDIDNDKYCGRGGNANELYKFDISLITEKNISTNLKNEIQSELELILDNYAVGLTENGSPIVDLTDITGDSDAVFSVNSCNVIIKTFEFDTDFESIEEDDENYFKKIKVSLKTTDYNIICSFSMKNNHYTVANGSDVSTQTTTLMPRSSYKAYVHFVDDKNIITNGIYIGQIDTGNRDINKSIICKYKCSLLPIDTTYKAFFISLINVGNIICECFGYTRVGTTNIVNCLEADTLLYNINDDISVWYENTQGAAEQLIRITKFAKYYPSSNTNTLSFGNCGYIAWDDSDARDDNNNYIAYTVYKDKKIVVKIEREKNNKNKQLIKTSSYIEIKQTNSFTELPGAYYGSYFCPVKKPSFSLSSRCYVAGNDVYNIDRTTSLELTEFKSYIQVQSSPTYFIASNFNLNYLSLTEDIPDKIFNIGSAASGIKEVAKVINSANLSYIYELKGMYKDFMNKTFKESDTGYKTTFDNTVRVSNVLSDETFNNSVFKFDAKDYYNIPTDRGIIVNLFSIGNKIFAHTKGSLYNFDANQTISASNTDITLQETEPFNAGISQVFDSQYGYGGIDNKEAGCITFDAYFFYDRLSNHIFAYQGNGQIQIIDSTVYKLLKHYNFTTCNTIHDDINHRILFYLTTNNNKKICISYNYKAKSFVSLHDLTLDKAFFTRNKCYSYNGHLCELFNEGNITNENLDSNLNILKLYGDASNVCSIFFGTNTHSLPDTCFNIAVVIPTVENIREVINNIKYIGDVIKPYIGDKTIQVQQEEQVEEQVEEETEPTNTTIHYDLILNDEHTLYEPTTEEDKNKYPVNPVESMYIITDSCLSNIIKSKLTFDDESEIPIDTQKFVNSYQGIRHDIDSWNVNFFRNILHKTNIFDYPNQPRATQPINVDNNSLVYGKYFIIVFNFIKDKAIKIEELFTSTSKY